MTGSATERQTIEQVPLPASLRQLGTAPMPCVVPVPPSMRLPKLIARVKNAGTRSVALLVPNGTKALQTLAAMTHLHHAAAYAGIHLTVYAADQTIVQPARHAGIVVIEVQGTIKPPQPAWKRRMATVYAFVKRLADGRVVRRRTAAERAS